MLKKITMMLIKKDITLEEHKLIIPNYNKNKYAKYMYIVFGVIFSIYLIDLFTGIELGINGLFVYVALTLLVLYPLATRTDNPYEALILTKSMIIKRDERTELKVIEYDRITKFRNDKEEIYIIQDNILIALKKELYEDYMEILIDILEAKGKTFDKAKDYMIRPIEIVFEEDGIKIKDLEVKESETEKVTASLYNKYEHLTPGFIDEIIPRNTIIREVVLDGPHLQLLCSALTVKHDHPENTGFDNLEVDDSIFVFENALILEFAVRDSNERAAPYNDFDVTSQNLIDELTNSVVDDWKYEKNVVKLVCKAGLGNVKIAIKYKEVIIGWNSEK